LQWDQGSLLKQLDIIGQSGRNWPIRDTREQLTLLQNAIKASRAAAPAAAPATQAAEPKKLPIHARSSSHATGDPHASLHLSGSREEIESSGRTSVVSPYAGKGRPQQRSFTDVLGDEAPEEGSRGRSESVASSSVVSPYGGNRPSQRSFADILGDEPAETEPRDRSVSAASSSVVSPYGGHRPQQRSFADILGDEAAEDGAAAMDRSRAASPTKSGYGKNYQPMRLFESQQEGGEDEETPKGKAGNQYIRPNAKKFSHFDFADGSDPQDGPKPGVAFEEKPKSKHDSQWSFNDFVTPHKSKPSKSTRAQDVRHWGTEEDAWEKNEEEPAGKARRDAETHFELQDDGDRVAHPDRAGTRPRGATHNENLGLYKNNVISQEEATPGPKRALGNITNIKDRGKDFDAHWTMTDDSPSQAEAKEAVPHHTKAVKMMESNWSSYDESPVSQKENARMTKARDESTIHIAGDGMGGKKGTDRSWMYGGGGADEPQKPTGKRLGANQQSSLWDM
jgi:hypothetical protein